VEVLTVAHNRETWVFFTLNPRKCDESNLWPRVKSPLVNGRLLFSVRQVNN